MKAFRYILILLLILVNINITYSQNSSELYAKFKQSSQNGDYSQALKYGNDLLQILEDNNRVTLKFAQLSKQLAIVYISIKDYENAIKYIQKSIEIIIDESGKNNAQYLDALNLLHIPYKLTGNYDAARNALLQVIEIAEDFEEPVLIEKEYADALHNLAGIYFTSSTFDKSEKYYQRAYDIRKKRMDSDDINSMIDYAKTIYEMGILYSELGNADKAESFMKEALYINSNIYGNDHQITVDSKLRLANHYLLTGQTDKAATLMPDIESEKKTILKSDSEANLTSLMSYGNVALNSGNYDEAKQYFLKALEITEAKLGRKSTIYLECLQNLGVANWISKNYPEAKKYLHRALDITKENVGEDNIKYASLLQNLAGLDSEIGSYKEADDRFKKAFGIYLKLIRTQFPFLSEKEKAKFSARIKERFEMFNCYAAEQHAANPSLLGDMYNYQLATKALLLQSSKKVKENIRKTGNRELLNKYEKLISLKQQFASLCRFSKEELENMDFEIDSIQNNINILEKEISEKCLAFSSCFAQSNITWKDIQKKLVKNEAAIEIIKFRQYKKKWTGKEIYVALYITSDTKDRPGIIILDDEMKLDNDYFLTYQLKLQMKKGLDELSYYAFWKKIEDELPGVNKFYISPDGVYHKINIGALYNPERKKYLLDDIDIHLMISTRDIVLTPQNTSKEPLKTAVLFGDPQYNLEQEEYEKIAERGSIEYLTSRSPVIFEDDTLMREVLKQLPGTRDEVDSIYDNMNEKNWDCIKYLGMDANEATLKSVENPAILHIATHGQFLEIDERKKTHIGLENSNFIENPLLRSRLFFAGAENAIMDKQNAIENEGILTAYEAMNMNLGNTELVVLSACETACGEVQSGEGVYGMQRAFQVAGAKTIIMSLWNVGDRSTQKLMVDFYRFRLEGMSVRDAFKAAQQEMKSHNKHKHPFYWGAFVIVGE